MPLASETESSYRKLYANVAVSAIRRLVPTHATESAFTVSATSRTGMGIGTFFVRLCVCVCVCVSGDDCSSLASKRRVRPDRASFLCYRRIALNRDIAGQAHCAIDVREACVRSFSTFRKCASPRRGSRGL